MAVERRELIPEGVLEERQRSAPFQVEIVVRLRPRASREGAQSLRAGGEPAQNLGRRADADPLEIAPGGGVSGFQPARWVDPKRMVAADQEVIAPSGRFLPERRIGKDLKESADHARQVGGSEPVSLDPLTEHPSRREAPFRQPVELDGEQVRHAGDPGVRGLRDDQVVPFAAGEKRRAGVVEGDPDPGVPQRGMVRLGEPRRRADDTRDDLDDADRGDRVRFDRAEADPARQTDQESPGRATLVQEERQVRRQELRAHVGAGRRLGATVDLKRQNSARAAAHRDAPLGAVLVEKERPATAHPLLKPRRSKGGAVQGTVEKSSARHQARLPTGDRDGEQRADQDERRRRAPDRQGARRGPVFTGATPSRSEQQRGADEAGACGGPGESSLRAERRQGDEAGQEEPEHRSGARGAVNLPRGRLDRASRPLRQRRPEQQNDHDDELGAIGPERPVAEPSGKLRRQDRQRAEQRQKRQSEQAGRSLGHARQKGGIGDPRRAAAPPEKALRHERPAPEAQDLGGERHAESVKRGAERQGGDARPADLKQGAGDARQRGGGENRAVPRADSEGRRRRFRIPAISDRDGDETDREVDRSGRGECVTGSQKRQEQKRSQPGAGRGPESVQAVKNRDRAPRGGAAARAGAHQKREGGAHQTGGRQ